MGARMHGEHRHDHGRRQQWEAMKKAKPAPVQVPGRIIEVPPACPCDYLPWPHYHPLPMRSELVKEWNIDVGPNSPYRLEMPKPYDWNW